MLYSAEVSKSKLKAEGVCVNLRTILKEEGLDGEPHEGEFAEKDVQLLRLAQAVSDLAGHVEHMAQMLMDRPR